MLNEIELKRCSVIGSNTSVVRGNPKAINYKVRITSNLIWVGFWAVMIVEQNSVKVDRTRASEMIIKQNLTSG